MLFHPVKIGSLTLNGNIFLAPVAGYSDKAFRSICINQGASFTYTEMVSAEALTRGSDKTQIIMERGDGEKQYAVQIFGGVPETMAKAALLVKEKTNCECIDINAGCPVPKIIKSGAGSSLTKEPEKLYKITKAVVDALEDKIPVTVKIRSGWDEKNITFKEAALAAKEAGAKAITLHPRTRSQGYEGKADWEKLSQLVELIGNDIPVFGSGDLFTPEDAKNMLEQTNCSGIMFARGAMGNPFIFKKTIELLTTGSYNEIPAIQRIKTGFWELSMLSAQIGEQMACKEMRKRFCAYSKGLPKGAQLRQLIVHAETTAQYKEIFAFLEEE